MTNKGCHRDEAVSAAPWISPGLVRSNEVVLRTIHDPHHIERGKLNKAAIATSDLMERGWSVDRMKYTSAWRIRLSHLFWNIRERRNGRDTKFFIVPVSVGQVRGLLDSNGGQFLSVTDEAMKTNPAHAAIVLASSSQKSDARKARTMLVAALPPHIEVAKAFKGSRRFGWSLGMIMMLIAPFRTIGQHVLRKIRPAR